jgi:hypothetical protein
MILAYASGHALVAEYPRYRQRQGSWRAHRLLRRAGRRLPRLPLVQRPSGRGLHGRPSAPWPWEAPRNDRHSDQARVHAGDRWRLFVVEALSVIVQVASFKSRASGSFECRRCITTSSCPAGAK